MKKTNLKFIFQSYFYTLQKEQQGIYLLLFLLGVIGIANACIPLWVHQDPITVQLITQTDASMPETKIASNLITSDKVQKPSRVELNTTDSVALEKLYKIGPKLAGKIIAYRTKLGGFHSVYQLTEIYGFQEDFLYDLQDVIYVNPSRVHKFNLNTCELASLQQHPYFKYSLSKQLIRFREQHGAFNQLTDIKALKTMNDSIYNLILPYIEITK